MAEIRQIQVDGVNYDLVISEDEVSATRAEQAAQRAANSATQAASNSAQASEYSVTAGEYAQDAQDAADRAEAIVGGQFVSYGEDQGLTDSEKETARTNIGVTKHSNANLLDNWYWVGGGTAGKFPINQRGKNYYEVVNDYTIDRWKSVTLWSNNKSVKVATQTDGVVLAGDIDTDNPNTYVQFQQIIQNPPHGKEVTLSVLVDNVGPDDDGNYPQIWYGASAYKNITTTGLTSVTFTCSTDTNENYVRFVLYDGTTQASSIRIQAVKLELGAVSTLEQDVAPDYGTELTRCLYSNVDSVDTYGNSGYGRTNPNILRNWDFTNPVNSRAKTMYSSNEYAIDGWKIWGNVYARVDSGYVALAQGGSGGGIFQYLEGSVIPLLNGKTVTYSAVINDTLYSATGVFTQGAWIAANTNITGVSIVLIFPAEYPAEPISASIRLESTVSVTINVKSVKVEVGGYSTLLNTPPQVYAEELAKCIYSKAWADDTYANNGFGRSNRNLLDNWYFVGGGSQLGDGKFPINQRGQTSYSGASFDRWIVDGNVTATLQSGGLRVQATSEYVGLYQHIPMSRLKSGETYTYSIIVDGNLISQTFTLDTSGNWVNIYYGSDWYVPYVCANGVCQFKVINSLGSFDHTVKAVKLEKGTYSTLANDVPPNFGEELAKCKAYFQRVKQPQGYTAPIGFGIIGASSNILRTLIPLSSPLRDATSITASATNIGQMKVWGNGSYFTPSAITGRTVLNGHAVVDITVSGSLQNYMVYHIILHDASTYIDLSAEL